jgi:two-component system cell cycle response regulator
MFARILVIEDNMANLDLMAYLLRAFGHTLLTAENGAEGLATANREELDLILCDVQLPIMDGYEVARELKKHPRLRTIPLVAVTALAMVGDRDNMLLAGFDGYIAKPITPETFVIEVEAFLQPKQHTPPLPPFVAEMQVELPPESRATILVVDDRPVNLDLARSIFEPSGYTVLLANSRDEAMLLLERVIPDVIVSDVHMADGSGYDFILGIKADPRLHTVPFIFITSTAVEARDKARGLALGAARFLVRPLDAPVLLAEIEACLRQSKEA